jgi:hypothetical protein
LSSEKQLWIAKFPSRNEEYGQGAWEFFVYKLAIKAGINMADLHQLWRRMVFNIAGSNTCDHLRIHGFLLTDKGWRLVPAYNLNIPRQDQKLMEPAFRY